MDDNVPNIGNVADIGPDRSISSESHTPVPLVFGPGTPAPDLGLKQAIGAMSSVGSDARVNCL
jgi:hypothetical protein